MADNSSFVFVVIQKKILFNFLLIIHYLKKYSETRHNMIHISPIGIGSIRQLIVNLEVNKYLKFLKKNRKYRKNKCE